MFGRAALHVRAARDVAGGSQFVTSVGAAGAVAFQARPANVFPGRRIELHALAGVGFDAAVTFVADGVAAPERRRRVRDGEAREAVAAASAHRRIRVADRTDFAGRGRAVPTD